MKTKLIEVLKQGKESKKPEQHKDKVKATILSALAKNKQDLEEASQGQIPEPMSAEKLDQLSQAMAAMVKAKKEKREAEEAQASKKD